MRFFLDSHAGIGMQGDDVKYKATRRYLEVAYPLGGQYLILYYIIRDSSSVFVATCWEHAFDDLLEDMDEDDLESLVETWPLFGTLLANGIKDRYREGALIKLEDCDDGESKWFVASVAGNIDVEDIEDLFSDRVQEISRNVVEKSAELIAEINTEKPSALKQIGKGLLTGIGIGILAALGIS